MLAGTDDRTDAGADLFYLAEAAVLEIVSVYRGRHADSAGTVGSPLGALVRGRLRYVDAKTLVTPSDYRSWLLTVELCGKATVPAIGFDGLVLVAELDRGSLYRYVAQTRGWRRSELQRNYDRAVTALLLEFCSRGVTREIRSSPET